MRPSFHTARYNRDIEECLCVSGNGEEATSVVIKSGASFGRVRLDPPPRINQSDHCSLQRLRYAWLRSPFIGGRHHKSRACAEVFVTLQCSLFSELCKATA